MKQFLAGHGTYLSAALGALYLLASIIGIPIPGVPAADPGVALTGLLGLITAIFVRRSVGNVADKVENVKNKVENVENKVDEIK